ncbi:glycosyltransferase [Lentzea sp. BCCO 10_0798]|uniref:Glycosyltransferase n=1 Tax=Lentzea kristufekii TaxID=3095430 RepID=A0ABU4U7J7_9PSEU|nr:glycosyltransferase [Lentzea sp. BCCO 10_0798]MDX8056293.1 glycosyltransferase [Lentzea sp. BCCO 10_0798]
MSRQLEVALDIEDAAGQMRIAMVSVQAGPLPENAGQGAHVAELCAGLSASGHEPVVYTRRGDSTSPATLRADDGYDIVQVPAGPARALAENELVENLGDFTEFLADRWREQPPDVVHSHHWTSGLVSVIAAHRIRVPVVHSYHGFGETRSDQRSDAESLIARRAAWITATSSAEAAQLSQLGVRRSQLSVVPSGVNSDFFNPDGPIAVHDGRMRVAVTGELAQGNSSPAVDAVVSAMDHVALVDANAVPRTDRPALLRSADVAVCAPAVERYGSAALEAMACGVPVVATAVGALSDVVLPDVTGLLIPPRDGRRLAQSLKALLADETRREQFGIAARDRVLGRYSRSRLAKEAMAVYQRVATDSAATGGAAPARGGRRDAGVRT